MVYSHVWNYQSEDNIVNKQFKSIACNSLDAEFGNNNNFKYL